MKSILSFYKKIYEQELSQAKTLHLYSSRVLKRFFVSKKEELLNDENPYIPLGDTHGEEIIKTLELKANEVSLKYYSLGRIARFISLNKYESTRVYPLFSYEATVTLKDGEYYLQIDKDSRQLLKNNISQKITGRRSFKKIQHNEILDFHFASALSGIIKKETPKADSDELMLFPKLWTDRKIKSEIKKDFVPGDKYIPLGVLAIVEKENNSFTTLDELNKLEENVDISAPLNVLFGDQANQSDEKLGIICEELNESQYNAIVNSNEKIVSVVSGPPGTGKSFTIANLAAEKVSKGKSILITSKNKEALDVIEEKIKGQLGINNLCVNPSQDKNFAWMKDHLNFVLGRQYKHKNISLYDVEDAFAKFQKTHDKHLALEKELMEHFRLERNYASSLDRGMAKNTTLDFRRRIFTYRGKTTIPLWESLNDYYKRIDGIRKKAIKTLHLVNSFMLEDSMKRYRTQLREYLSFLRARNRKRKTSLSKGINYDAVLMAFPVWLVRANDVSRVLPLKKEAFDILIIDEASQCDIPSIIPLMQRAKKVVIVGDTKQLTHISFISKAFERSCMVGVPENLKHLCQHRDRSILHLVEDALDPQDRVQLNEHFRSQFPIIAFSNNQFYQDRLEILTKRPISVAKHVQFLQTNGKRDKGYNTIEAQHIFEQISEVIRKETDLPNQLKTSIGILSPFRKQVDHLFSCVVEAFSINDIKAHKIIVGTAFTFQGNERDVMHISMCLDNDALGGSFTFLNRKDVFNVSITRARNLQFIYHSFDPSKLKSDSTIAHFFRFYDKNLSDDLGRNTKDAFCLEVAEVLNNEGLKTWTNFEISGVSIDILTQVGDHFIGIDLIGFVGEMEDYYSLERYKMIERGKVKLFPLSYPLWVGDRQKCIAAIKDFIEPKEKKTTETIQKIIPPKKVPVEIVKTKIKRKYTKFDINKVDVVEIASSGHGTLSFKAIRDKITYGQIWCESTRMHDGYMTFISFQMKSHKYKGIEEILIKRLLDYFDENAFNQAVFTHVSLNSTKEKEILSGFGFEEDSYERVVPYAYSDLPDSIRLIRYSSNGDKSFEIKPSIPLSAPEKLTISDIDLVRTNKPDKKGFSFELVNKKTKFGQIVVKNISSDGITMFSFSFSVADRHKHKGLEEKLIQGAIDHTKEAYFRHNLYTSLPTSLTYEKTMLERLGFVVDYSNRIIPNQETDIAESVLMVYFSE